MLLSATTIGVEPRNNAPTANVAQLDPSSHNAADDHGQRHGGHGADDGVGKVTTNSSGRGGPDDPANHDAVDDHGQRHGGHGADDVVAAVATNVSKHGGADAPANHDAVDDHGQRHGGHGTDDVVAAVATNVSKHGGADDPANHDAVDDRHTVTLAMTADKVNDHGADRQDDRRNDRPIG